MVSLVDERRSEYHYDWVEPGTLVVNGKRIKFEKVKERIDKQGWFNVCGGIELFKWYYWTIAINTIGFIVFATLIGVQNSQNGTGSVHPSRMSTPLTQTAGVWIHVGNTGVPTSAMSVYTGDSMSLGQCSRYNAFPTNASWVVQPVVFAYPLWLDSRYIIMLFFLLSALFQFLGLRHYHEYYACLADGRNHIGRFAEYSISYSLMVVIMCSQNAVTDFWLVFNSASGTFVSMWLLLLTDILFDYTDDDLYVADGIRPQYFHCSFFVAVVSIVVALSGCYSNILTFQKCFVVSNSSNQTLLGNYTTYVQTAFIGLIFLIQFVSLTLKPSRRRAYLSDRIDFENGQTYKDRVNISCMVETLHIILDIVCRVVFGVMVFCINQFAS